MSTTATVRNLDELLDRIEEAASNGERVSLDAILDVVGRRSFGPFLLIAGLITLAPLIGDIPGVPTLMALIVMVTAGQVLFLRKRIWLPQWLLKRSLPNDKVRKVLKWMRRPARFVDKVMRPRLTILTREAGIYAIALVCVAVAAVMPIMEFVPFSANVAGLVLTTFGLALISHDGVVASIAFFITGAAMVFAVYNLNGLIA